MRQSVLVRQSVLPREKVATSRSEAEFSRSWRHRTHGARCRGNVRGSFSAAAEDAGVGSGCRQTAHGTHRNVD